MQDHTVRNSTSTVNPPRPLTKNPGVVHKGSGASPMHPEPYEVNLETGCWIWKRAFSHKGYGLMWNGHKMVAAHRHYFAHYKGPIPAGLQLDHLCRVRACVNPDHLQIVNHTEHMRRGPRVKLNIERARIIRARAASGEARRSIANDLGLSDGVVSAVIRGVTWKEDAAFFLPSSGTISDTKPRNPQ